MLISSAFLILMGLASPTAAAAEGDAKPAAGPVGPADRYTPVDSGELFDTAQVLPKGRKQLRLSTQAHVGLSDRVQLDVGILQTIGGPNVAVEYMLWSEGHSAASLTADVTMGWTAKPFLATGLAQYTLGVGEWDRLNLGVGFGQGTAATGDPVSYTKSRTIPLRVSFDKVKSDRRVFRYNAAFDAGPKSLGGKLEGEGGVLWTYGFERFRISAGGGLRYAPTWGDGFNATLAQGGLDPIDFPDLLPKLDLNLWWAW